MTGEESDENPSAKRVAGWALDASHLGPIGLVWAVLIGIWGRRRHRRPQP